MKKFIHIMVSGLCLSGCNMAEKLSNVGDPPELSQIQNPELVSGYKTVSMPMPRPEGQSEGRNSLWQTGARAFFKDQRAGRVGDILTVLVKFEEEQKIGSKLDTSRTTGYEATAVTNMFGYEEYLPKIFPKALDKASLAKANATGKATGKGDFSRKDTFDTKLAATIIQILPNGNLVIQGRQEVRLAGELRTVEIKGIVRREDVSSENTVPYEKIAEARISNVTKGDITDMNTTPWGVSTLAKVLPF